MRSREPLASSLSCIRELDKHLVALKNCAACRRGHRGAISAEVSARHTEKSKTHTHTHTLFRCFSEKLSERSTKLASRLFAAIASNVQFDDARVRRLACQRRLGAARRRRRWQLQTALRLD